jgi:hypothetical protein
MQALSNVAPKIPRRTWADVSDRLACLKEIEKKLNIQHPTDWYNYRTRHIIQNGGQTMLIGYYRGSITTMLQSLYPDISWDLRKYIVIRISYD